MKTSKIFLNGLQSLQLVTDKCYMALAMYEVNFVKCLQIHVHVLHMYQLAMLCFTLHPPNGREASIL